MISRREICSSEMYTSSFLSSYHSDLFHMVRNVFWNVMVQNAKIWSLIYLYFFLTRPVPVSVSRKKKKLWESCCSGFFETQGTVPQNLKLCLSYKSCDILKVFNEQASSTFKYKKNTSVVWSLMWIFGFNNLRLYKRRTDTIVFPRFLRSQHWTSVSSDFIYMFVFQAYLKESQVFRLKMLTWKRAV